MLAGALVAKEDADVGAAPLGVLRLAIEALLVFGLLEETVYDSVTHCVVNEVVHERF